MCSARVWGELHRPPQPWKRLCKLSQAVEGAAQFQMSKCNCGFFLKNLPPQGNSVAVTFLFGRKNRVMQQVCNLDFVLGIGPLVGSFSASRIGSRGEIAQSLQLFCLSRTQVQRSWDRAIARLAPDGGELSL